MNRIRIPMIGSLPILLLLSTVCFGQPARHVTLMKDDTSWLATKSYVALNGGAFDSTISLAYTKSLIDAASFDSATALAYTKYLISGKLSWSDSTTLLSYVKSLIAGKQASGTYLVPGDSANFAKKSALPISVLDYGATRDSTGNSTAAIQSALNAAGALNPPGVVIVPSGKYLLGGAGYVDIPSGVTVSAYGAIFYKVSNTSDATVRMVGATTATTSLTTATVGYTVDTLHLASTAGFAVGDYVVLYDETYVTDPNDGRNQELNRITAIVGDKVTLATQSLGYYSSGLSSALTKIAPVADATLSGLTIVIPTGLKGGGILLSYTYQSRVTDCKVIGPNDIEGLAVNWSAHAMIDNNTIQDGQTYETQGKGIGFNVHNSHNVIVESNYLLHTRASAVTFGCRYVSVRGNQFVGSHESAFNIHGTGNSYCEIVDNTVYGSFTSGGILVGWDGSPKGDTDILVSGNFIRNPGSDGILVEGHGTKGYAQRIKIVNNYISNAGNWFGGYHGIYVHDASNSEISGNFITSGATTHDGIALDADTNIVVFNNTIASLTIGNGIAYNNTSNLSLRNNTMRAVGAVSYLASGTNAGLTIDSANTVKPLLSTGLIDSVKTSDTVQVGFVYPGATITAIKYSGARGQSLTARLELVDSLYQTAGVTLLDTATVTTQLKNRTSVVNGGSFALTIGKIVRLVFPVVGTMPKQFNVSVMGY